MISDEFQFVWNVNGLFNGRSPHRRVSYKLVKTVRNDLLISCCISFLNCTTSKCEYLICLFVCCFFFQTTKANVGTIIGGMVPWKSKSGKLVLVNGPCNEPYSPPGNGQHLKVIESVSLCAELSGTRSVEATNNFPFLVLQLLLDWILFIW